MRVKNPPLVRLGHNIRVRRQDLCLSQEALGFKAGLDRTYVGGVERGERNISLLNLIRIAYALGLMPMDLLEGVMYVAEERES